MIAIVFSGLVSAADERSSDDLLTNTSNIQQYTITNSRTGTSYNSIQEAINSSLTLDGDTITCKAGKYNEDVLVWKSLTLVSKDKSNTFVNSFYINGSGSGTSISGFTITGTGDAITLMGANKCVIYNNVISSGYAGITLVNSSSNKISANIIDDSVATNQFGIRLENSDGNNIYGNYIESSLNTGIRVFASDSNRIKNNIINTSYIGICIEESSYTQIDNNDVNCNSYYGIYNTRSNYSRITGNEVNNNSRYGVKIANSEHILIDSCIISNSLDGVHLDDNSDIVISKNIIYEISSDAISVGSSNNVKIVENNIYNNDFGVYIWRTSTNVSVNFNRIVDNSNISMYYTGSGNVDATLNWWGYNDMIDVANQIDVTIGTGNFDYEPWIVLTVKPSTANAFGTSVTADLLHDNNGVNHNPAKGVVPYTGYANFNTTLGTITDAKFVKGVATSILRDINTAGTATVSTRVDHQTTSVDVEVNPTTATTQSNKSVSYPVTTTNRFKTILS